MVHEPNERYGRIMKKILLLFLSSLLFLLVGCTQAKEKERDQSKNEDNNVLVKADSKSIIIYFSKPEMTGVDTMAGASRVALGDGKLVGNVQMLAQWIGEETKFPISGIEPVESYPNNHDKLVEQATEERTKNYRPKIQDNNINLDDFDTIYLGYPIWWGDMPMALYSFLESHDLSGKTIIPFSSHGGSGLAGTVNSIKESAKGANVLNQDILTISRDNIPNSRKEVNKWLKSIGAI